MNLFSEDIANGNISYGGKVTRIECITPERAKDILEHHNHNNRNISKKHVEALAAAMSSGEWSYNTIPIMFSATGELANGQHRLSAIVKSGQSQIMLVSYGLTEKDVRTIDQESKCRSLSDILKMEGVANYINVAAVLIRYCGFVCNITDNDYVKSKVTPYEMLNIYYDHEEDFKEIINYAWLCYNVNRIVTVSEIGSIYAYLKLNLKHDDKQIEGFFDRLCRVTSTDCAYLNYLRNLLLSELNKVQAKRMKGELKRALICKAWNYWITGKKACKVFIRRDEGNITLL